MIDRLIDRLIGGTGRAKPLPPPPLLLLLHIYRSGSGGWTGAGTQGQALLDGAGLGCRPGREAELDWTGLQDIQTTPARGKQREAPRCTGTPPLAPLPGSSGGWDGGRLAAGWRAGPGRAGQSRAGPGRAEQRRAAQRRAEQRSAAQSRAEHAESWERGRGRRGTWEELRTGWWWGTS